MEHSWRFVWRIIWKIPQTINEVIVFSFCRNDGAFFVICLKNYWKDLFYLFEKFFVLEEFTKLRMNFCELKFTKCSTDDLLLVFILSGRFLLPDCLYLKILLTNIFIYIYSNLARCYWNNLVAISKYQSIAYTFNCNKIKSTHLKIGVRIKRHDRYPPQCIWWPRLQWKY